MRTYTKQYTIDHLTEVYDAIQDKYAESEKNELTIAEHSYRNGLLQAEVIIIKQLLKIGTE